MLIMRFTDMVMSFPYILLVLVAAAIFEPGLWSIILILGFVDWPGIARLVRGNVLSLRETKDVYKRQGLRRVSPGNRNQDRGALHLSGAERGLLRGERRGFRRF